MSAAAIPPDLRDEVFLTPEAAVDHDLDVVRGLYRGLLPNFLKTLPAISISYATFEWCKRNMSTRWGDDDD